MKKEFNISKSNYYIAYREGFHANGASWVIYVAQVILGIVLSTSFYWLNLELYIPNWLFAFILPVVIFIVVMFVHRLSVNAIFKESPELFGEKTFEISSGGISEKGKNKPVTWDKLDTYRKSKNYLFLFGAGEHAYFVFPKMVFSEFEISQIENWFGEKYC